MFELGLALLLLGGLFVAGAALLAVLKLLLLPFKLVGALVGVVFAVVLSVLFLPLTVLLVPLLLVPVVLGLGLLSAIVC